jgi:hypothetical protein
MKIRHFFLFIALTAALLFSSCGLVESVQPVGDCAAGKGSLRLENNQNYSINVYIDGVNFGTLQPSASKIYALAPGKYAVESKNASTRAVACSVGYVTIKECDVRSLSCGK